jgi:hypothetical protein
MLNLVAADSSWFLCQEEEENMDWMKDEKARAPGIMDVWRPAAWET